MKANAALCEACAALPAGPLCPSPEPGTCARCGELTPSAAPVAAPVSDDAAELAALLPKLPSQIRFVLHGYATDLDIADTAERDIARACELLLAERGRVVAVEIKGSLR